MFFCIFFIYKTFFYHEKIVKIITCEEQFDNFDDALKKVEIYNYRKDFENASSTITGANIAWQEFLKMNQAGKCVIFQSDTNLAKKLFVITESISKAHEIAQEKSFESACQLALTARADLLKLKKDNSAYDISLELFDFFIEIDKLEKVEKKAEVMSILPDLKYKFTGLKQYNPNDNFLRIISEMEKNIGYLDKFLDGPDFQKAKSDLSDLFWEIYYEY